MNEREILEWLKAQMLAAQLNSGSQVSLRAQAFAQAISHIEQTMKMRHAANVAALYRKPYDTGGKD